LNTIKIAHASHSPIQFYIIVNMSPPLLPKIRIALSKQTTLL